MAPKPPDKSEKSGEDMLAAVAGQLKDLQLHFNKRCDALQQLMDRRWDSMAADVSDLRSHLTSQVPPVDHPPKSSPNLEIQSPVSFPIFHPPSLHQGSSSTPTPFPSGNPKSPKIQLPSFDGSNPLDWIFQAEQYFDFYNTPPDQRLSILPFYFQGDALGWFHWLKSNQLLSTWDAFLRALELRFGLSSLENPQASLFKLLQTTTVAHYQLQFERLCNRVLGLSPETILNCFLSGLRIDIQQELAILRPHSISQAIGLAKLIESKLSDSRPPIPHLPKPTQPLTLSPAIPISSTSLPSLPQPHLPFRRLTLAEMQEHRSKGLCFN